MKKFTILVLSILSFILITLGGCSTTTPPTDTWGDWVSNSDGTHTRVDTVDSTITETEACSGGTATETQRAICSKCGASYGEILQNIPFEYALEGDTYTITGIGSVTGKVLEIPSNYNGIPVTKIGNNAFSSSLATSLVLGENITEIGERAFYYSNIKTIDFNDKLTTLGKECFSYAKLESVTLPQSLTTVGDSAFFRCYYLGKVVIPENVTSLEKQAFANCGSSSTNKELVVEGGNQLVTIGESAFMNSAVKTFNFAPTLQYIKSSAFAYSKITSVVVPEKITTLNSEVFQSCSELESVTFNKNLEFVGASAFKYCVKLSTINFAEDGKLTEIGVGSFYGCTGIKELIIPDYVVRLGISAFAKCEGLTKVVIGLNVKFIGAGCFASDYEDYVNKQPTDGNPRMLDYLEFKSPEDWIQSTVESSSSSSFWYAPNTPEKTAQNYHNRRFFHWMKGYQVPKEPAEQDKK